MTANEGLLGRWYLEFENDDQFQSRDAIKWASWNNRKSFWIQREFLIQALKEAGFHIVLEQFDSLGSEIGLSISQGNYRKQGRCTFVGIKC